MFLKKEMAPTLWRNISYHDGNIVYGAIGSNGVNTGFVFEAMQLISNDGNPDFFGQNRAEKD